VYRSEIWWANLPDPLGSEPGYRRPVLIIQDDAFTQSRHYNRSDCLECQAIALSLFSVFLFIRTYATPLLVGCV
jgi:hypothetical protein